MHDPLIQAEDLHAQSGDPLLRIFDCRFDLARADAGHEAWSRGHLPGALHADLNRDLSSAPTPTSGRHPLPEPAAFEMTLRAWGVCRNSRVVVYDEGNSMFAARLWWMLRWVGHDAVRVLDGGLARWSALGLPVTVDVTEPAPGDFVARPQPGLAVDGDTVLAASRDGSLRILDARAPERYRGEVEPIDPVAGHVPGARNHPFGTSLGADGRFASAAELRERFEASLAGLAPGHAVAMCGSGVTACHLLLAMERAGLHGGRLYAGSWSEWSRNPDRPVARGAEP